MPPCRNRGNIKRMAGTSNNGGKSWRKHRPKGRVELPDSFDTRRLADKHHAIAPDGSEVRVLCHATAGSMAHFTLPPRAVSKAMAHRTVEEIWYFLSGHGRMWRRLGAHEAEVEVRAGSSITIPVGTHFQFRCDSDEPLRA